MRSCLPILALVTGWIGTAAAQSNDNFASRLPLSGATATAVSNNLHATRETSEPNHAANAAGRSLWWTWTAPATGVVNFSASDGGANPAADRVLAIYTGDDVASLAEVGSSNHVPFSSPFDYPYYSTNGPAYLYDLTAANTSVNLSVTVGTVYQVAVDTASSYRDAYGDDGTTVLCVNAPPTIASTIAAKAAVGSGFTYNILASNGPTAYTATGLPPGLSVNPATGEITGVPSATGAFSVGLSATGPGGTGTGVLTLEVAAAATVSTPTVPVITSDAGISGLVGVSLSYSLYGGTSYTATNLPPGLQLNATSGTISGTPTAAGIYAVPVSATNPAGTGTATITFDIAATPPLPVLYSSLTASGNVGISFYYGISTYGNFSTLYGSTSYAATGLPSGLALDSTGAITGTPTQVGTYPVALAVSNAGGTRPAVVTITVGPAVVAAPSTLPPQLSSAATVQGKVGTAFSYVLTAANSPTGFSASNLPQGLTFSTANNMISGTPTAAGQFLVPVAASNANGTSTGTLTITIAAANATAAAGTTLLPLITSAAAATGYAGQPLYYAIGASYTGSSYYYGGWAYAATGLPPGMSLGSSGTISGTPTTAGTYAATVSATTSVSSSQTVTGTAVVTFIIKSGPPPAATLIPVITSAATVTGGQGASFSYSVTATNSPTSYTATGLPPGLSMSTSGYVSGTPTTTGTYPVNFSAANASGTGTATVTMTIGAAALPVFISSATAAGTVGTSFTYSLSALQSPTGYAATNLPPGLTAAGGTISGTPTAAGVYTVPVSATNVGGTTNATLTITVSPATVPVPRITSAASVTGTVGSSLTYYISSSNATSYTASNLPPGVTLSSGIISGTPTAAGTYTVPISATNATGTGNATLTIIIATVPVPTLSGNGVVNAVVNASFSYLIPASGTVTAYNATSLPPGLGVNTSTGYITGTPTTTGSYAVPISAANSSGTANATLTINVAASAASASAPVIGGAAGAAGVVGGAFSYAFQATNLPTSYAVDVLPPGLTLNASTGVLSGKPTAAGTYTPTLSATNSVGMGQAKLTLVVAAKPTDVPVITSPAQTVAYTGETFCYPVTATNLATSFDVSGLPTGTTFDSSKGYITGKVTTSGAYTVGLSATNAAGTGRATLTLTVQYAASPVHATSAASASGTAGQTFSYAITTNTNIASYAATGLPGGLTLNTSTGVISGTPAAAGTSTVALTVRGYSSTFTASLRLVIGGSTAAPVVTSAAGAGGFQSLPFYYLVTATNSPTSFSAGRLPAGLTMDTANGLISGTPTVYGTFTSAVVVYNASGSTSFTLTFNLGYSGSAPAAFTSAAGVAGVVGVPLTYTPTGDFYFYATNATNLPPGLSVTNQTVISGTPTTAGTYASQLTIYSGGSSAAVTVNFNIAAATTATPVLTSAAQATGAVGSPFSYTLAASNQATVFGASGLPSGLSFDSGTRLVSGTPSASGNFVVPLTATNAAGSASAVLTLVIAATPPLPPTLAATTPLTLKYVANSSNVAFNIQAANDPASYAASGLPPGLGVNTATGWITGVPTAVGVYPVTLTAANSTGSASATTTITVVATSATVPVIGISATDYGYAGIAFGTSYTSAYGATSYAASNLPPGLNINPSTGYITGTPTSVGQYQVALSATNAAGTGTAVWTVTINNPATLTPTLYAESLESTGTVGQSFSLYVYSYPNVGSNGVELPLTLSVSGLPPGVTFSGSANNGTLSGTPTTGGNYPVTVTATTAAGVSASEVVTIVIPAVAPVPRIVSAAAAGGMVGSAFSYSFSTSATATSFSASNLPAGLSIDTVNGRISGTPTAAGTFAVPVSATNTAGTSNAVVTLQIIAAIPDVPLITSAASTSAQDIGNSANYFYPYGAGTFSYAINATQNPASFTAASLPPGLSLNPYTGVISGLPSNDGIFQVPVTATNAQGTGRATVTIIIGATPPSITAGLAVNATAGIPASYPIYTNVTSASQPYEQPPAHAVLSFAAAGLPPGLSLNTATGALSGTPTQTGVFPVTITATNRAGTDRAVVTFTISAAASVSGTATAPTLSGYAVAQGYVGVAMNYYLYGNAASYTATGLPAGLTFNTSTGRISGTPTAAGTVSVPVTATNSVGTARATLTVAIDDAPARPYSIGDAAGTAQIGTAYSYYLWFLSITGMPSPTGYAASNLPAGLNLNPQTGYITGTPTGPVGTYAIPISGSVGAATGTAILTLTILPASTDPAPAPLLYIPAGARGILDNPFNEALSSALYVPTGSLPDGLSYDPVRASLAGYPAAAATSGISLDAPATGGGNGHHVMLTLNVLTPDLSLPRLLTPPSAQTVLQGDSVTFTVSAVGAPAPAYRWRHDGVILPDATGPTLTLSQAQFADAGNYNVTITNLAGSVASAAVPLRVLTDYAHWQSANFTAQEIAAGMAADTADFDGDGVANLVEYALGRDPRTGNGGALPVGSSLAPTGALSLEFHRDASKTDLDYVVEVSTDLGAWTTLATSATGKPTIGANGAGLVQENAVAGTSLFDVLVQAQSPTGMTGQQFLRLKIIRH